MAMKNMLYLLHLVFEQNEFGESIHKFKSTTSSSVGISIFLNEEFRTHAMSVQHIGGKKKPFGFMAPFKNN